jgi:Na+/H+-dicarboxylate symporter/ABC-type amino acid transport substrate-binding protein
VSALTQPAKRGVTAISLPVWVVLGALAGIVVGVALGERTAVLQPFGSAYAMMLQIAVYPYLICVLICGLGRLTPAMARRLLGASWGVYLFLWCVTLAAIWLLALAIPSTPAPSVLMPATAQGEVEFLKLLIPANLIEALGRNYVPATVVFAFVYGVAIQKIERKAALFEVLEAIQVASVTIWGWIVRFAPIGVFALFADAAGTIEPARLSGLLLYVGLFLIGTLLLAFVVLPAVLAAVTPVGHREILKELQPALVIAAVTTLTVVALPFVQRAAERVATEAGCPESEERSDVIKAVLSLSYVLVPLGNYFLYLLMLYGAYAYKVQLTTPEELLLPLWTLLSGLGAPSAIVDGTIFLGHWLRLPADLLELFLETWTVTRYGQVVLSVMGFSFATMLIPLVYYGKVRLRPRRVALAAAMTVALFGVVVSGGTALRPLLLHPTGSRFQDLTLDPRLTGEVDATVLRAPASTQAADAAGDNSTLKAIQTSGVLRVGYNPNVMPFSYRNDRGELVGYDVTFAYELAHDLGVKLELIPFEWGGLESDLIERRFDVAMAGIYETHDRLQTLAVSRAYYQSAVALVVRSERAEQFRNRAQILALAKLRLAVCDDPMLVPMAKFFFPKAAIKVVASENVAAAISADQIDGVMWTLQQASAWAAAHPGFTAVAPGDMGSPILLTYMMPPGADILRRYVDQWVELKAADGFRAAQVDYWINGKPRSDRPPRWNLLDALMAVRRD